MPQNDAPSRSTLFARPLIAAAISAALLLVLSAFAGPVRLSPDQADEYHERVREAEETLPYSVGDWVGRKVDTPRSAIEILHPNVLVNRRYDNLRTGETASLLFVQCSDARDLSGHYPPNCYVSHGMVAGTPVAKKWTVNERAISGMRYGFSRDDVTFKSSIVVDNFMILPTGEFGRDMDAVIQVGKNRRLRHFGAAQVQVLTDASMSEERRDEIFETLVAGALPLIETLTAEAQK